MNWIDQSTLVPIDAVRKQLSSHSPASTADAGWIEDRLRELWQIDCDEICVTDTPWAGLFSALVTDDKRVFLAAPAAEDVLQSIVESGARYIDVGRDHAFCVDRQGWEVAASDPRTTLAYIGPPNGVCPSSTVDALVSTALAKGNTVVVDYRGQRLDATRGGRPGVQPGYLWAGIVGCGAGVDDQLPTVFVGDASLIQRIKSTLGNAGLSAEKAVLASVVLDHAEQVIQRQHKLLEWKDSTANALASLTGLVVVGAEDSWLWVRAPGIASADLATVVQHHSVIGSNHWTWRDAVAVVPCEPGKATRDLVDAFQSAL